MPNRRCRVSFTDTAGITHVANVTGENLYEAGFATLAALNRYSFTEVITGPVTRLRVAVESPSTEREISVGQVCASLEGSGRSPNEQA